MKKMLFVMALAIPLLATKCASKPVNLTLRNLSDPDIAISSEKDSLELANLADREVWFHSEFNSLRKGETKTADISEGNLYQYLSKDGNHYTFYFFKIKVFDAEGKHVFEKKYDSINVPTGFLKIGEEEHNTLTFEGDSIRFSNK
jgi:hypothetical protein